MLNAAEWARVEVLFAQLAELDAAARSRLLARECADQPRVRAEVEALLAASATADGLLDGAVPLAAAGPTREPKRVPAGTRLGAWRVRSLIGHGGMGEVYLAERADGAYVMNAAIKLLKPELFSFDNAQRFLRERRVLARLSHPNIARVLDAGTSDDGRPYLVMEYADGARITDYARTRGLGPRAAAALMLAVTEAVAEAHRQGVVHRDLKPANVLVTGATQVKLLDFGIARLLDEDDAAAPATALTPAYAAPEQILGVPVTPAADVYALGVMLYQLLTGRLPHRREGLPVAVIAAGLGVESVERPSQALLRDETVPDRRRQAQALAGDLDWIALQALQLDPLRRYTDAGALAEDLRRYLEHRPVLARRNTVLYRATRFLGRYPTQVAALLIAAAAVAAALVGAWR